MGMAASQARLLTITAQIHDVEYQAQSIQNAKIQLSNQSDQVYQDYLAALDATTLTVKDYNGNVITANFNNLCGMNAVETGAQYALRASNGALIVSDEIKDGYDDFMSTVGENNAQAFAMYMMDADSIGSTEKKVPINTVIEESADNTSGSVNTNLVNNNISKVHKFNELKFSEALNLNISQDRYSTLVPSSILSARENLLGGKDFLSLSATEQSEYRTLGLVSNSIAKLQLDMDDILNGRNYTSLRTTEQLEYDRLSAQRTKLIATQESMSVLLYKKNHGDLTPAEQEEYSQLEDSRAELLNEVFYTSEFMANLEAAEQAVAENHSEDATLQSYIESMNNLLDGRNYNDLTDEEKQKYDDLETAYRHKLYTSYSDEIYTKATGYEDFDTTEFSYYVSIFNQIQAAGGNCISISDYDGTNGDAASNSDWLQNMIQCGKITLELVETDKKNGKVTLNSSSPSSDTYVSYTETTSIDKTALAKAEAEYEHATKQIDAKDKQYDMKLSELETEREALTTQYDSLKTVIKDNIERTFGIFS